MLPGAPFVQFTYATVPPIPKALDRVRAEGSERVWMNIPPARVWVYRQRLTQARAYMTGSEKPVLLMTARSSDRPASGTADARIRKFWSFRARCAAKSYNVRLAALATKELTLADADVTRISLADYPLPIYDADLPDKSGPPFNALKLKQLVSAHHGVFIASPEYNASITPLLKNTIDWISVVREPGEPQLAAYQNRVFAIGGASPGRSGAHAVAARAAAGAGDRLPRAGDRRAGRGAERRAGVRRDG